MLIKNNQYQAPRAESMLKVAIFRDNKEVGYIQLVFYYDNMDLPHIEYELKPGYRRLGIMSEEIPKYLSMCESLKYKAFVALVRQGNIASKKLLLANKFNKIATREDDVEVYLFSPKLNKMAKEVLDLTLGSVSDKYLNRYITEFCFKYNNRKNQDVFDLVLTNALGA
jgi:RimJ/RimL family protein N-acetyltransferase